MSVLSASELLTQIKAFNANAPDLRSSIEPALREDLHRSTQRLAFNLEDPQSALTRLTVGQSAEAAVLAIAFNIGLFPAVAKDGRHRTLEEISEETKSDSALVLRLLRFLAAFGTMQEFKDGYALSTNCALLGDPAFASSAGRCSSVVRQMFSALPEVVRVNGNRNLEDRYNGAVQRAFNAPGKELYEILLGMDGSYASAFAHYLSVMSGESGKPQDVYPIQERLIDGFSGDHDSPLWVDVGGGIGQFTLALKKAFPNLPGRCVVQEQAAMVKVAEERGVSKLIDFMIHDFFTEQPIKGARAYYLRNIFHNWQDPNCKVVLERLRDAMELDYSRVLIHDIILPETQASVLAVCADFLMMAGYSTLERSEKQWHALIQSAGLRISKIYSKATEKESIIEIVKV